MLECRISFLVHDELTSVLNSLTIQIFEQVFKQTSQDIDAYIKRSLWDKIEISIHDQIWNQVRSIK